MRGSGRPRQITLYRHVPYGQKPLGKAGCLNRARFFTAAEALQDKETADGDALAGVVVKAEPVQPAIMPQAEFLLEFQAVAFDAPTFLIALTSAWKELPVVKGGSQ